MWKEETSERQNCSVFVTACNSLFTSNVFVTACLQVIPAQELKISP